MVEKTVLYQCQFTIYLEKLAEFHRNANNATVFTQ